MTTIKVEYIGKKPFCIDNVAKSGKVWNGPGDVQEVTLQQAKILTSYRDQWALVEASDVDALDAPYTVETQDAQGETVLTDAAELNGPLEKMTAAELVAYAKLKYGKTLKANRSRKILLDEVLNMGNDVDFV
ncbi:hypothetical protein [Herminiimonas sp. CN]|uniref:hypothetical protein n=1 Tax=Herminiimonas sp. CN TaxID=1349818 RepID=UPI000473FC04|nr:hypothetical protein [Herminiimonas sp. CN]